ncbi:ferrochelatase [Pelagicoccus sp. SDUM812005]|uniref:ferrochelatase n=1 Tax=Pelagicoccus sp. SDUM812005 TaxID=3041257 RepID=UPI00280C856E|nr:ferrochelatase [Pelagicoccus sp. SDUM812005]MDQ8180115.1 ferrochelatase [Pelagicoccus sp. SDUM812005]
MSENAVLLVNLGSPDSTSNEDVRRYLKEFLSDDRVIDSPKLIQQFVLNCFILPKRPAQSAAAYKKVWTEEGSPLIVTSKHLQSLLQEKIEPTVELAMRYGSPSIPDAIDRMKNNGVKNVFLVPLYPHYAMSSYETVVVKVMEEVASKAPEMKVTTLQPFYGDPSYIEALYKSAKPYLEDEYDHLLFSYHGIPNRHLNKADSSKAHCNVVKDCCTTCSPAHATCYRHQVTKTTELFVKRAGIPDGKWSISFQSRLGREPWLMPYTDHVLEELPKKGIKRLVVMTPAFVSDCLETLEEIAMEGKEEYLEAGGEKFTAVPCMNEHPAWVQFLADKSLAWLDGK